MDILFVKLRRAALLQFRNCIQELQNEDAGPVLVLERIGSIKHFKLPVK